MRRLLFSIAAAAAVACSESVSPGNETIAGDYPLRTVNGHALPQIIIDDENGTESIVGGVVILRADQTFVDSTEVQVVSETGVAFRRDVGRGTWRATDDSVFFRIGPSEYSMSRNGAELVQDFFGIELVYRR